MGKFARDKGARGEREWRDVLRAMGYADAERGCQRKGGPDSPDVKNGIPGTHCEVKRTERLSLYEAMAQADADAGDDLIPYIAHKRNGKPWLVIVAADDLKSFALQVLGGWEVSGS
jgi:Holliday junction resolvase